MNEHVGHGACSCIGFRFLCYLNAIQGKYQRLCALFYEDTSLHNLVFLFFASHEKTTCFFFFFYIMETDG